jgi:predicted nucleic acid-binding Zn ribbon protein
MERLETGIRQVLRSAGVPASEALTAVTAAWPGCVGPAIARNAWPLRISRDGTLQVACTSSTWAFELGRMAPELLASLASAVGELAPAGLRFAPGPVPAAGHDEPEPTDRPAPTADELAEATRLTATIESPELRDLARRAIAASLADRRFRRPF